MTEREVVRGGGRTFPRPRGWVLGCVGKGSPASSSRKGARSARKSSSDRRAVPRGWRWLGDLGRRGTGYLEGLLGTPHPNPEAVWPRRWGRGPDSLRVTCHPHALLPILPSPTSDIITGNKTPSGAGSPCGSVCPAEGSFQFLPQLRFQRHQVGGAWTVKSDEPVSSWLCYLSAGPP